MVDKTISLKELEKLQERGAKVTPLADLTKIEQFGDLIQALKTMTSNEEERIRADLARNQTNLEILATLQSLIRKQGQTTTPDPVDLSPIKQLLEDMRAERECRDRASYEFEISRDGRGFAQKITAKPVGPTLN